MPHGRTYDRILKRVRESWDEYEAVDDIALILGESVKNRINTFGELMIRGNNPRYSLIKNMGLIDKTRGPRLITDEENDCCEIEYHFLNKEAIELHRGLAYEGYYGNGKF